MAPVARNDLLRQVQAIHQEVLEALAARTPVGAALKVRIQTLWDQVSNLNSNIGNAPRDVLMKSIEAAGMGANMHLGNWTWAPFYSFQRSLPYYAFTEHFKVAALSTSIVVSYFLGDNRPTIFTALGIGFYHKYVIHNPDFTIKNFFTESAESISNLSVRILAKVGDSFRWTQVVKEVAEKEGFYIASFSLAALSIYYSAPDWFTSICVVSGVSSLAFKNYKTSQELANFRNRPVVGA